MTSKRVFFNWARGNGIRRLFECAELVAYVRWLLTGILPPLYQAFSRSVRRDVISSVDTTAHSQQRIVPQSWGPRLFLLYWLYLKHINNAISRIRWSLSEPHTHLPIAAAQLQLRSCANRAVRVYGVRLNEQNVKYFCYNHEISLIGAMPEPFFHIVCLSPSSSWWASCSTGHSSSWIHNQKRICIFCPFLNKRLWYNAQKARLASRVGAA